MSKTFGCPGKDGMKTPLGKVTVNVRVAVAMPLQGSFVIFVALMVMGKTPAAVGVPEISPGIGPKSSLRADQLRRNWSGYCRL